MPEIGQFRPRLEQHGTDGKKFGNENFVEETLPTNGSTLSLGTFGGPTETRVYTQLYNFDLATDAAGRIVDHDNYFTSAPQSQFFTVTLHTDMTSVHSNARVRVWLNPIPTAFSDLVSPFFPGSPSPNELDPPMTIIEDNIPGTDALWVLNGSVYDLVFKIDFNTIYTVATSPPTRSIMTMIRDRTWNGRLALDFQVGNGSTVILTFDSPYIGTATCPFYPAFTGWDGRPADRGRPVLDMRTGTPAFAEDLVEDGFHSGIWTSQANWDPVDPRDVHPVDFPDDEGQKKDDVPV